MLQHIHRITEQAEVEGTHKEHPLHHWTTQIHFMYILNVLPLFWRTNNVHIDPIQRIMHEHHSHIFSLLLRSTVNVCSDIFITGNLSLLLDQIPYIFLQALAEECTTRHE